MHLFHVGVCFQNEAKLAELLVMAKLLIKLILLPRRLARLLWYTSKLQVADLPATKLAELLATGVHVKEKRPTKRYLVADPILAAELAKL